MARTKTRRRRPAERQAPPSERKAGRAGRYGGIAGILVVALAAFAAFWIGKEQAQGPSEAVAPPAVGLPHTPDYHSLLVDASDSRRVLLGTHVGVYETTDGGRSWAFYDLEGDDAMTMVEPARGPLWVTGHYVFKRSDDGGATWTDVSPDGLPSTDVHGFAVDPGDALRVYAAVAGEGLYLSTDGGATFELVSEEVGVDVYGLAVTQQGRLLAAEPNGGLKASDDGGRTWRVIIEQGVVGVSVNPADAGTILATGPGVLRSTDGGTTWRRVLEIESGAGPVAWAPGDPDVAYVVGLDRKLYRTSDAGATWQLVA